MITVALAPGAEGHRAALAGLPRSFRLVGTRRADVVAVAGEGWVAAAGEAIAAGARGVLVSDPAGGDPRALDAGGAVVAIESPVADPAWTAAAPRLREALGEAEVIDSVVAGPPASGAAGAPPAGLIAQLALLLDLGAGAAIGARLLRAGAHAVTGVAGGVPVTLAGVAGGRPELRFDVRARSAHWSVRFDRSALAVPTRAVRYERGGGELIPADYRTARRETWRRLAGALTGDQPVPFGPDELAAVLTLASGGAADGPPPSGAARG